MTKLRPSRAALAGRKRAGGPATKPLALGRPLPRSFYARSVLRVARDVLGRLLVREDRGGMTVGRIVEVEAYRGADDPASHAFRGLTPRTAIMFGPPGHAYVYFTYGVHHCLNLVVQPQGQAAAVLIRALEPMHGLERMKRRRGSVEQVRLARGPGCVAQALRLDRHHDGLDLVGGPLWVSDLAPRRSRYPITRGPRIGIRRGQSLPWRFYLAGHPCVSGSSGLRRRPVRASIPRRAAPRGAFRASRGPR